MIVAGALRLSHINWDQFQHVHPDERFIVWVADSISAPKDLATALDPARSTINPFRWPPNAGDPSTGSGDTLAGKPRSYAYGHFPLYLLVVVAHAAQAVGQWLGETTLVFPPALQPLYTVGRHLAEYDYLALVGRAISALCDLGTLLLVYALAQRAYEGGGAGGWLGRPKVTGHGRPATAGSGGAGERGSRGAEGDAERPLQRVVGLLAAGAYTFAVLPIQLSHFYAVDMVLTFCVVAAVALAARWAEAANGRTGKSENSQFPIPNPQSLILAGVMTGLAVGSKFTAVLLIVPLTVAACYGLPAERPLQRAGDWARKVVIVLARLAVVLAVALAVFILTNPFAVIEIGAYVLNILAQNAMVSGVMDAPYTRQYIGTVPYWYFIQQLSQWGLGWPLGIVAWGGFIWALVRAARRRASPALVVMLAWALPYFALTGAFHAKFLRYMAPLLPFLIVFGAGAAVAGYRWLKARRRSPTGDWARRGPKAVTLQAAWAVAAAVVAIFTVGWALAFTGVYRPSKIPDRGEHPWIQASRWIYENVPEGSKLLTEHWDDALPLALDELPGRPRSRTYTRVELPLYDPDTPAKLDTLVAELSSADYIVIASNRLYAPIQRLPGRYPMTSHYYQLLFSGQLGYRQVAEFTAYPRLDLPSLVGDLRLLPGGGLVIPDDHADESFTVYDHPRAIVFANTERLSESRLRARLGRYLPGAANEGLTPPAPLSWAVQFQPRRGGELREAVPPSRSTPLGLLTAALRRQEREPGGEVTTRRPPGHAAYRPTPPSKEDVPQPPAPGTPPSKEDVPLTLSQPVDTLPVVADFRWNKFASEWPPAAIVLWWLVLSLFGWAAWPLLFPLLRGLADRGYGLARVAGWLLVGWVHWLAVSLGLWQNRVGPLAAVLGALALLGLIAGWLQRRQIATFWTGRRRLLLAVEGLFALAFLAFVGLRLLNPDLWQPWNGGEKFMEFAFLNATLRSPNFPPYDPYFAGGTLNYYYFGLYLVGIMIKLTGIVPEVAFNLAVPGLFALTALGVFSVGYSLAGGQGNRGAEEQGSASRGAGEQGNNHLVTLRQAQGKLLSPFDKLRASSCHPVILSPFDKLRASSCRSGVSAILAVVLALLMGNLAGLGELLREVVLLGGGTLDYNRPLAHFFGPLAAGATMIARGLATPAYDFWAASRVIPNTINEFPFWTFLFADLHPHLIAMPLGMLVVGLALNWITNLPIYQSTRFLVSLRQAQGKLLSTCLLVSLSLGALGATNTWDLPVYFVLVAAAFLVTGWRRGTSFPCWGSSTSEGRSWRAGVGAILAVGAIGALAVAAYWPFYTHYQAQVGNEGGSLFGRFLAPVRAASPLGPWLVVWGFFVFLAFCFVLIELRRRQRIEADKLIEEWESAGAGDASTGAQQGSREAKGRWSLVSLRQAQGKLLSTCLLVLLGITVLLIALDRPTAALLAVPFGLAVCFMFRRRIPAEDAFLFLLLAMGLGVVAGTELFYLRDFLEGSEWYRMNTLFKFGIPAWLFLGLAAGVMLPRVWNVLSRGWAAFGRRPVVATDVRELNSRTSGPAWLRVPWQVITILLLAAGLAFLPLGIPSRVRDRFPGPRPAIGTLDGTAYMTVGRYNWPTPAHPIELAYDYLAIHWLLDHVTGTPVVAEAPAGGYEVAGEEVGYDYYRAGGLRVASLTGFPTFLGQHQFEQRPAEQIWPRAEEGQEFFRTTDLARARELMRDLNVGYVYVGTLERILFPIEGLRKFDALVAQGDLEVAYRNPEVAIYRVVARAEPPL